MGRGAEYLAARERVIIAALRVISHYYDREDDPGWQAELDDEMLDKAVKDMAIAMDVFDERRKEMCGEETVAEPGERERREREERERLGSPAPTHEGDEQEDDENAPAKVPIDPEPPAEAQPGEEKV